MRKITGGYEVYAEFFTNGAVAWFTAGVITPLFTKPRNLEDFIPSIAAIVGTWIFLVLAKKFIKEEK